MKRKRRILAFSFIGLLSVSFYKNEDFSAKVLGHEDRQGDIIRCCSVESILNYRKWLYLTLSFW